MPVKLHFSFHIFLVYIILFSGTLYSIWQLPFLKTTSKPPLRLKPHTLETPADCVCFVEQSLTCFLSCVWQVWQEMLNESRRNHASAELLRYKGLLWWRPFEPNCSQTKVKHNTQLQLLSLILLFVCVLLFNCCARNDCGSNQKWVGVYKWSRLLTIKDLEMTYWFVLVLLTVSHSP